MNPRALIHDVRFRALSERLARLVDQPGLAELETAVAETGPNDSALWIAALSVQSIGPLLDAELPAVAAASPAAALREEIALRRRLNRVRMDDARRLSVELQQGLAAAGVEARALKAAWLMSADDFDRSQRVAADLDFLVLGSRQRAARVARDLGWVRTRATAAVDEWARPGATVVDAERGENPGNPLRLELHFRLPVELLGESRDAAELFHGSLAPDVAACVHLLAHHTGDLVNQGLRLAHAVDVASAWARLSSAEQEAAAASAARLLGVHASLLPEIARDVLPHRFAVDLGLAPAESPLLGYLRARPRLRLTHPMTLQSWDHLRLATSLGARLRLAGRMLWPSRSERPDRPPGLLNWYAGKGRALGARLVGQR